MEQEGNPPAHQLVELHGLGVVQGEALHVGMELDAVQAQLQQMLHIAPGVRTVGMKRAEGQAAPAAGGRLAGQELVDVLDLVGNCGGGAEDGLCNAGLGLGLQHVVQGRGLLRNLHPPVDLVELRHRLGGLFCNGVGVYVTVKI